MDPIRHNYSPFWFMNGFRILFDILGLLIPILIIIGTLATAILKRSPITIGGILGLFIFALFSGFCFLVAGNYFIEITSDEDGLHTTFLWKHLVVPWEEIIEIRPLFNIRFLKQFSVIRTRSLTPFHRLLGLLYSFTTSPCIIFSTSISNYDELNRRINLSLRKNRKKK